MPLLSLHHVPTYILAKFVAMMVLATMAACGDSSMSADASAADSGGGRDGAADAPGSDAAMPDGSVSDVGTLDVQPDAPRSDVGQDAVVPVESICEAWADPVDDFDQSVVPVAVEPAGADVVKVLLVPGLASEHAMGQHEFFAGAAILARMLCQTPGVVPVIVRGWPDDPSTFADADAVVFYADGGATHPLLAEERRALIRPEIERGVGFVVLHYALEGDATINPELRRWAGGNYEAGFSQNPWWEASFESLPAHPALSGVPPHAIFDEWYYNMRWEDGAVVTPLLQATPASGGLQTVAWAYERPDTGRSFGFTGGHFHGNWTRPEDGTGAIQRRVVTQGILWAAGVAIPPGGVPVEFPEANASSWRDSGRVAP